MGLNHLTYKSLGSSLGVSVITLCLACVPASAEELKNWSFDKTTNELTFSLPDTILPEFFLLAEPPRLVLDIPETEMGDVEPEQFYDATVQTIRVAQHTEEQVRVVIELTPEIVLAPEQADIQFDDRDGQRHWRFRPLIESHIVTVDPAAARETASTLPDSVSHSAANLAISERPSEAILPIDPYDAGTAHQVVSVPPLEDIPDLTEDVAINESAVPEVPPMVVPSLEETATETAIGSLEADNVVDTDVEVPELTTNIPSQQIGLEVDRPLAVEPTEAISLDASDALPDSANVHLTQTATDVIAEELANESDMLEPDTVAITPGIRRSINFVCICCCRFPHSGTCGNGVSSSRK